MSAKESKNRNYYLHSLLCIVLMFIIGFLPPIGGITVLGMKVLSVFIGVLYGWIFIGFIWPSLLGLLALGLTGYASVTAIISAGFGDALVLKIFFMFIFAAILEQSGLTQFVANWCVSRKVCMGRPWVLTALIFAATWFISGFVNLYGGIVIMWYIFYNLCEAVGFKKGDGYTTFMIAGIVFTGLFAHISLPFLPMPIIFSGLLKADTLAGMEVPMASLTVYALGLTLILIGGYILLGRFLLRVDVTRLKNLDEAFYVKRREARMEREHKLALIALVFFIVVLLLPSLLPAGTLKAFCANLDILGPAFVVICLFVLRRDANGEARYSFSQLVTKGINWDLIVMFAATGPISAAMESADTGIIDTVVKALMPLFQHLSPTMFLILTLLIFIAVTQLAHNLILIIVFMPVLAAIGMEMGINPFMFNVLFVFALQNAFMTPGASAQATLIFGNTDWIERADSYKICAVFTLFATLLLIVFGIPLGYLLF